MHFLPDNYTYVMDDGRVSLQITTLHKFKKTQQGLYYVMHDLFYVGNYKTKILSYVNKCMHEML